MHDADKANESYMKLPGAWEFSASATPPRVD